MSGQLGISWGLNQEQQRVGQEPKTSSTADEEICNNKEESVYPCFGKQNTIFFVYLFPVKIKQEIMF